MAGRPLKFSTPEELEEKANEYFTDTPFDEWTITGLALALDTTRKTLVDYDERDIFSNTVKKLKTKIEHSYEVALRKHGRSGEIFALKNFDWSDKQEQAVTATLKRYVISDGDDSDLPPPSEPEGNN